MKERSGVPRAGCRFWGVVGFDSRLIFRGSLSLISRPRAARLRAHAPPPRVSLTIPPSSHTLVLMYLCVCECVWRNLLTGAQVCSSPYPNLAKSAVPTSGGVSGRGRRRRDCSTVVSRLAAELGGVFRVRPFVAVTGTISKRRREGAFVRQRAQGVSAPRACAGRVRRRLSGGRSGRLSGGGAVVVV